LKNGRSWARCSRLRLLILSLSESDRACLAVGVIELLRTSLGAEWSKSDNVAWGAWIAVGGGGSNSPVHHEPDERPVLGRGVGLGNGVVRNLVTPSTSAALAPTSLRFWNSGEAPRLLTPLEMGGSGIVTRGVYPGKGPYPGISKILFSEGTTSYSIEEDGPRKCRGCTACPVAVCMTTMTNAAHIIMLCPGEGRSGKSVFKNADLIAALHSDFCLLSETEIEFNNFLENLHTHCSTHVIRRCCLLPEIQTRENPKQGHRSTNTVIGKQAEHGPRGLAQPHLLRDQ
jgi:hypothetical protein